MAESSGVNEAGKAWITISVNDETQGAFEKISADLNTFSATVQKDLAVVDDALRKSAASQAEYWGNLSKNATAAGQMLTAGWDKFSDKGKEAVSVFAQVDDELRATFAKVDGISEEQAASLTEMAKRLGRHMSFTTTQVAEGMTVLASQGFGAEQIEAAITPVMNLARATQTAVPDAALIAANAMHQFGLESEDMTRICDVLTTTTNKSAQGLADIGYAIQYSGTNYSQAGSSLEDYMKLLGSLANFGTKGSMGGTSLRTMLARSISPQTQAKLEARGISVKDEETGNLKSMAEILAQIARITDEMGTGDKQELLLDLFGQRGMTGAASLLQGSFETMEEAIDHAEGAAQRASDAMDAGIGGSQRMMASAIEALKIAYGEAIAPNVQDFYDLIKQGATAAAEWIGKNRELVVTLTEAGLAVSALGGSLLVLGAVAGAVRNIILLWGPTMTALSKAMGVASSAAGLLGKAFLFITANPIVGVLAAAAALAGLIGVKMYQAAKSSKDYSSSMSDLAKQHEADREAQSAAVTRLQELQSQTSLTNEEYEEQLRLTAALEGQYKSLGGEMGNLTEAQQKLYELQRQQQRLDLVKQEAENEANIAKAEKNISKRVMFGGKEFTREEIEQMDKAKVEEYNNSPLKKAFSSQAGLATYYQDRMIYNPATDKYKILSSNIKPVNESGEALQGARETLGKMAQEVQNDIIASETLRNNGEQLKARLEALDGTHEEETAPAAEAADREGAAPNVSSSETGQHAAPVGAELAETSDREGAVSAPAAEEPPAANPYIDPDVAAALNMAGPASVPFQAGDETAIKMGDLDAGLDRLNGQLADFGGETGQDPAAADADAQLAVARELYESSQTALKFARQSEEQQAQEQGEQMQQSVADWKNGPGSASYQRMDVTDKAIVETAENTRITADYAKKLYDLLSRSDGAAAFAQ